MTRLHGQLQRTQQHLMASTDLGSVDRKVLDDLYEDIHWLILVSGQQQDIKLCVLYFSKRTFSCRLMSLQFPGFTCLRVDHFLACSLPAF